MLSVVVKGEELQISAGELEEHKNIAWDLAAGAMSLIEDVKVREFVEHMWENAPDYFFIIPASVSGRHHAEWSTDKGGLVRHVLMGVKVAYDLARTFGLTDLERDLAMAAMFGHDILKYGLDFDMRYINMHPFLPRDYFGSSKSKGYAYDFADTEEFDIIMAAIERHMGNIATGEWTSVNGIKPETPLQQVVHLADYIASRKDLVLTDFVSGFQYQVVDGE
ncbi:HD domain-containing protein [Bacillus mycoides]|uniref:HD domain-containing protein n=1 Tax=Bacillus mycoides TaxID=1405 RepID=UPI003A813522